MLGAIWRCWYGFPTVGKGVSGLGGGVEGMEGIYRY